MTIPSEQLDTPWAPQEIAWLDPDAYVRATTMDRLVAHGGAYLVREVQYGLVTSGPNPQRIVPESAEAVTELLLQAEQEFKSLEALGVHIPSHTWYMFFDSVAAQLRVLTRVQIVDCITDEEARTIFPTAAEERDFWQKVIADIKEYQQSTAMGRRFHDLAHGDQLRLGYTRPHRPWPHGDLPDLYLLDIEPLLNQTFYEQAAVTPLGASIGDISASQLFTEPYELGKVV